MQSQNEANSHHSTFQPISAVKSVGARDKQGQYATSSLPLTAAVATINNGTIKEVTVSRSSTGKASQGGLVVTNSGTISNCTSYLPVHGTSGVVGGIAKESVYSTIGSMPVIENCTVDARVDGETELATLLNNVYNIDGRKYRVSDNFTVSAATWNSNNASAAYTKLNGNDKTITTNVTGNLFTNINTVKENLTITYVTKL